MSLKIKADVINGDPLKLSHMYKQVLVTLLIATTLLNYGLQSGWVSPMKNVLQLDTSPIGVALTDDEMAWIASGMPLSAVFGTSLYAYLANAYGRKVGVIAMIIPQVLCWVITLVSNGSWSLMAARICAGIPAGGCFNLVPMYINEISQDNIRGAMVALAMAFINIGYLAMFAMGGYMNFYLILWIGLGFSVVAGILFIAIAPDSPAFLVKRGKFEDAAEAVANLRSLNKSDLIVKNQIDYMIKKEEDFRTIENLTFAAIFKNKAWLRGFLLCTFNLTILNFNGTLSINTYALTILTQAGVTVNPELQTLALPAILLFGSIVSMTCVEKFGRKRILVGGFVLSTLSLACVGTSLLLQQHGDVSVPSWIPVLAIVVAIWSYAAGGLPIVYVIISEMFTFQVRTKLIGVLVTYAWFVSFVQVYCYLPITNTFGMHTTFFAFAGVNLLGAVVSPILVPETMGKTVEEIEQILRGHKDR